MAATRPTRENPIAPRAAVLALSEAGLNSTEIAEHFGVSRQRISQILQANGISPKDRQEARRQVNRRYYAKVKKQRALAREGLELQRQTRRAQIEQLANHYGVTAKTLASYADRTGPYRKRTVRPQLRSNMRLPNRWTPEGDLLANQIKATAAPWSARHLFQYRKAAS